MALLCIHKEYPDAKIILSIRDSPEVWVSSIEESIYQIGILGSRWVTLRLRVPLLVPLRAEADCRIKFCVEIYQPHFAST